MSSTNRNGHERHLSDYYITPHETVREFLYSFESYSDKGYINLILDPCAGGDETHGMTYPEVFKEKWWGKVDTIDIREDSPAAIHANYLNYKVPYKYDFVCSNPPFNLCCEFILKGLEDVVDGGYVAMLTRLNFYGAQKRKEFFQKMMPKYCFVHSKRPSFIPKDMRKKLALEGVKVHTDSTEYCHLVYQKGYEGDFTELRVI